MRTAGEHVVFSPSRSHQRQWWQRHSRWFHPCFLSHLPTPDPSGQFLGEDGPGKGQSNTLSLVDQGQRLHGLDDSYPVTSDLYNNLGHGELFTLIPFSENMNYLTFLEGRSINNLQMFMLSPLLIGFLVHQNELITILAHYMHIACICLHAYSFLINSQNLPPKTNAQILMITDIYL